MERVRESVNGAREKLESYEWPKLKRIHVQLLAVGIVAVSISLIALAIRKRYE